MVVRIGADIATVGRSEAGPPGVLLPADESVIIEFEANATSLSVLAMVAPTTVLDNYLSNVVDVHATAETTIMLNRFDIDHDENTKTNTRTGSDAATVTTARK